MFIFFKIEMRLNIHYVFRCNYKPVRLKSITETQILQFRKKI